MRHLVLTRSAYGPAWDIESNQRRLEVTKAVTVPSMAAQTDKDWTWLVAIDRNDPLKAERKAAFESAGVKVRFLEVTTSGDRDAAASELYRAPWGRLIGSRKQPVAMTRLDDDDALAFFAIERLRQLAPAQKGRTALIFPFGVRVWLGCYTAVTHFSNAMQTLVTQPGDTMHVYGYKHRFVAKNVDRVRRAGSDIAWVWSRHPDTISGWHSADPRPVDAFVKARFPIDWSIFGEPNPRAARGPGGRFFR